MQKKKWAWAGGIIFAVLLLDQILKWSILEHVIRPGLSQMNIGFEQGVSVGFVDWLIHAPERLPFYTQDIFSFFNITMVWNEGVSFGLMASDGDMGRMFLIALALVISSVLLFLIYQSDNMVEAMSMAVVIGGALGNIIDRVRFGAVADFLDFHLYGVHFPVFNVADSAITLGVAFLIFYGVFLMPKDLDGEKKA